jgi:DNA-binding beta-propeller fold protein YncE
MNILRLTLVLGVFAAEPIWSAELPQEALLVLSKGDHTLAVVDAQTLKVVGKAPVGLDPHEVIASTDRRFAYVSNYGGGAYNTLAVIDLSDIKALSPIDLGALRGPHGLTFVGGKLWFTAEGAKAIGRFDPESEKIDWILGTGQNRTHMIYVTPNMNRIYTTNVSSGTVTIIQKSLPARPGAPDGGSPPPPDASPRPEGPPGPPRADWEEVQISVGRSTEGFDVSPDGKQLWAANAQTGAVSVIDLRTSSLSSTFPTAARGANRLKFTPDGKLVFISSLGTAGITILDAATRKEVKHIDIGRGAAGIQMQPDGSRAFVACTGPGYVAAINLKTLEITSRIDAGPEPDGLAWLGAAK